MKRSFLAVLLSLAFVACEKDTTQTDNPNPTSPQALQPTVASNPDALLVALNISSTQEVPIIGTTTVIVGSAVASFPNSNGDGQNAGSVSCDGNNLSYANGSYVFQPSQTNPTGLQFGSSVPWSISGGSGIAAFNASYNRSVPSIGAVGGASGSIKRADGLSLSLNNSDTYTNISSADSLLFVVYDKNGKYLQKTQAKSQTTASFTAAELNTLATGAGYVQVNAYNFEVRDVNGLEVVFINQGSNTVATEWK